VIGLHTKTQLYLQSNRDMYMWNQVSCTKSYYANVETSSPYNQWLYLKVSCPHDASYAAGIEKERDQRERGTYCLRSREGEGYGDLERGRERYQLLEVARELRHVQTEAQGLCRAQHPATWTSSLATADPQGRVAAAPPPPHLTPCYPPPRLAPPPLLTSER
jgi:hypothetical protein